MASLGSENNNNNNNTSSTATTTAQLISSSSASSSSSSSPYGGAEFTEASEQTFIDSLWSSETELVDQLQSKLEENGLVKRMLAYKFRCSTNANTSELSVELKRLIVDVLDTKCKSLIAWARRVPRFGSLQIEDRTVSIEMNFLDIILLDSMWMSLVSSTASTQFALTFHNQYLQIDRATCKQLQLDDLYDRLFSLVARLADMQLTRDEFLCLKVCELYSYFSFHTPFHNHIRFIILCYANFFNCLHSFVHDSIKFFTALNHRIIESFTFKRI